MERSRRNKGKDSLQLLRISQANRPEADGTLESESADEMKAKVQEQYPDYSGMNYLDMTVGFFFPNK